MRKVTVPVAADVVGGTTPPAFIVAVPNGSISNDGTIARFQSQAAIASTAPQPNNKPRLFMGCLHVEPSNGCGAPPQVICRYRPVTNRRLQAAGLVLPESE